MGSVRRVALALLAVALVVGGATVPAGAGAPRTSDAPHGVTLTANPPSGVAPLPVDFILTIPPNTTEPAVVWSFGDGSYLNGTGMADLTPVHEYASAGEFLAVVSATWPSGVVTANLTIVVTPANVTVGALANGTRGVAPLEVQFTGTASGGTGTFVSFLWSFGDGDVGSGTAIRYTFLESGEFSVTLVVTDSRGDAGRSSLWVNVSAAATTNRSNSTDPGGPATGAGSGAESWSRVLPGGSLFVWVLGAVVAIGGVAVLGLRWKLRRRSPEPLPPGSPPSLAADPVGPSRAVPVSAELPDLATATPASPTHPPAPRSALPLAPPAQERQIANRTIRHLAGLPRLAPGDIAGPGRTQAGIVAALGAGQSAVSRVLAQLERAGVVTATTAHVSGSPRRVKVYELTPRGERLGMALRETATPSAWVAPGTGTSPGRSTRRRPGSGP